MSKQWLICAALAALLAGTIPAGAQSTGLSGVVTDEQGGLVAGVHVVLTGVETGSARETVSDGGGRYVFTGVAAGLYQVSAEREGFRKEVQTGIQVTIDRNTVLNLGLHVGAVSEAVVVNAEPSPVELRTAEVGALVDERRVGNLPLNGRDWLQLAELQPGVVRVRNTGFASTSNSANGRISVSGQRPNATNFFLDGTDISVYSQARPPGSVSQGLVLGVEAIREFRIVTSGYSAEYGNKSGGLVDIVTKSGTNELHGSLFWFERNDALDARNFFDPGDVPEFRRHQFGASVGGPLQRNRTFFFANYEALREAKGTTSGDVTPNADTRRGFLPNAATGALEYVGVKPEIAPYLVLYPLPNGADFGNGTGLWTGNANRVSREDFGTLRVDHRLAARDSLYGRYTFDDSHAYLPFGGNASLPGFPRANGGRDQVVTVEETHTFSPTMLNTLRLSLNRRAREVAPSSKNPDGLGFSLVEGAALGAIRVGGLGNTGNSTKGEAYLVNNVFQLAESVSYVKGRHEIKAGVDLGRVQLNDTVILEESGTITFGDLRGFLAGTPTLFRGALPGADYPLGLRFTRAGMYAQDNVRLRPGLTLNLGLRYEPWSNVTERNGKLALLRNPLAATGASSYEVGERLFSTNPTLRNWAPRLGFAWDPLGTGKTSIRGGFGMFYDTPYNGDLIESAVLAPPFVQQVEVRNPGFPNVLAGASGNPLQLAASLLEYDNPHWPSVIQYHLSVQRELAPNTVLSVSYNGTRSNHLVSRRELNAKVPQILPDGTKYFPANAPKRNPAVGSLNLYTTDAKAWYDGMQMSLTERLRGLTVAAAYTFAKAIDEAPPGITQTESSGGPKIRMDSDDLRRDKGLSVFDVRHAFAVSLLWDVPVGRRRGLVAKVAGGWQLSTATVLTSGNPFTPLISFNSSRSGVAGASASNADRPNAKPGYVGDPVIGSPDGWYDPAAFELPAAGYFGNLGRSTLHGPGFANTDVSAIKEFAVAGLSERARVQFRLECFNLLNHANFGLPGDVQNSTSASYLFTDSTGKPSLSATRPLRTANDSREMQFAVKLVW